MTPQQADHLNERVRSEKRLVENKRSNGGDIGWNGQSLVEMLQTAERQYEETGHCFGVDEFQLKEEEPIRYEKMFSKLRGGLVNARETAKNIAASPIINELGELCFVLYTPEGDSIALSTGIIVHVHTASDAIKWMIRQDYEQDPGIEPGDILCNNEPFIGDVHNTDIQTIVPIFWEGELVGWAAGITHETDIGATTPGALPTGPTSRFDDGLDIPAQKVGENDQLDTDYELRTELGTRAPDMWKLNERCRLAGCHMIRSAVHELIEEEGIDPYKRFVREIIEDGRREFKQRLRELTIPGRYRAPTFTDLPMKDEQGLPIQAAMDRMMHAPLELEIGADSSFEIDFDGANAQGSHPSNGYPTALQGAIWVLLTQTIIPNDKINDGAYYATETSAPPGTWCNPDDVKVATSDAWYFLRPSINGLIRSLGRSFHARGYIEEVFSGYCDSTNYMQGEGNNMFGEWTAVNNMEHSSCGSGARGFTDGIDCAYAMWNPEADLGEIELWEAIEPALYLGRRLKPNTAGMGRYRGGSAFESLRMVWKTDEFYLENHGNGNVFNSPGIFGGYPAAAGYIHNVRKTDLEERIDNRDPYPTAEGTPEDSELFEHVEGQERQFEERACTMVREYDEHDLYLSIYRGGGGLGDPLERGVEAIQSDLDAGHVTAETAEQVFGVRVERATDGNDSKIDAEGTATRREQQRKERLETAVPVRDWIDDRREVVENGDFSEAAKRLYNESLELSTDWGDRFRTFWDLPEDFSYELEE